MTLFLWCLFAYAALQVLYALAMASVAWWDRKIPEPQAFHLGPTSGEKGAVLVHGFADGPEAWRRQAEVLVAQGWGVEAVLLSHSATEKEWLDVIGQAMRAARSHFRHVELWGHSMGGGLAVIVASELPPDRLVLYAPFFAPWLGRRFAAFLFVLHRVLFRVPWTLTFFPSPRFGKGENPTAYAMRRVIPTRTFAAMLRVQKSAGRRNLACPTSLLLSKNDTVVDNKATLKALPHADLHWASDPTASHALTNAACWRRDLEELL